MYFSIHPEILQADVVINFDVYLLMGKNYVLFVKKDQKYSSQMKNRLRDKDIQSVYIREGERKEFKKYLSRNFARILKDTDPPIDVRSELLYDAVEKNIKKIFSKKDLQINNKILKTLYNLSRVSIDFLNQKDALKNLKEFFLHDNKTYSHCVQVYILTLAFMNKYSLSEKEKVWTGVGVLLHDLGKLKIPSTILNKPGSLNGEEWKYMMQHPVLSLGHCTQIKMSQDAINVILLHHEKCDRTGYPIGLAKDDIPLPVRMMTFCDVYDAITSDRPYSQKENSSQALRIMESEMRKSLDMSLFEDFSQLINESESD